MENIAKALVAAQMEMTKAHKGSENPHYRSRYADLGNVMDACLPALNKNGIAVVQTQRHADGEDYVVTQFIHTSGETLETAVRLLIGKADMQGMGSAITYARRYGLMELAGIAPEDDDGNAAASTPAQSPRPSKAEPLAEPGDYLMDMGSSKGKRLSEIPDEDLRKAMKWIEDKRKKDGKPDLKAELYVNIEKHLNGNMKV